MFMFLNLVILGSYLYVSPIYVYISPGWAYLKFRDGHFHMHNFKVGIWFSTHFSDLYIRSSSVLDKEYSNMGEFFNLL